MNDTPTLSVLCTTPDSLETLANLIVALRRQTIAKSLELVIVGPACIATEPFPGEESVFHSVQRLVFDPMANNPQGRAKALRAAHAPYIVFTEDHCFPSATWAEALVSKLREGYLGVGPVMRSANENTAVASANFLIEYGHWATAEETRDVEHLPGHNSAYQREALMALGEDLEKVLRLETPWLWEQCRKGAKLCITPDANSHHFNYAVLWDSMVMRFRGGRMFASERSRSWSKGTRLRWALAWPLIAAVRWKRLMADCKQLHDQYQPDTVFAALPLLIADAIGEGLGYLTGPGGTHALMNDCEFHRGRFTADAVVTPDVA